MDVSVIIPAHNPDPGRLRRALAGLAAQPLPADRWETILVDNASEPPLDAASFAAGPRNLRITREPELGLTAARRRGLREGTGACAVFVDDDNVLAPDYLEQVVRLFEAHPRVGAIGGRIRPEYEADPPRWIHAYEDLLACRDLGDEPRISDGLRDPATGRNEYPLCAPVGAGMALRREAVRPWLDHPAPPLSDRRGGELTSGGDNDIVLTLMEFGWEVAYFPTLGLTHLIPAGRVEPAYLARLNRGIQKSWMQVLTRHDANPWPPIARWTVPLRKLKAWAAARAWSGPVAHIRWQGACGHFEGRVRPEKASHGPA